MSVRDKRRMIALARKGEKERERDKNERSERGKEGERKKPAANRRVLLPGYKDLLNSREEPASVLF